jgi:MYXO-CTERM domain-containing protein
MRLAGAALRLAAVLSAAALAGNASAYVRSSDKGTGKALFWPMPIVPYRVSSAPAAASPTCSAGPAGDPALDAARAAFSEWRQGCSSLDLVYGGRIDEVRTGLDGTHENLVVLRQGWCSTIPQAKACMDSGASGCGNTYDCFEDHTNGDRFIVALTSALYDPATGRIVNADIEVNGWDGGAGTVAAGTTGPAHGWYFTCDKQAGWPQCTTYGQADCFYIDLQNTLTHEAGHFLGLAHPCETNQGNCTPEMAATTMYPATTPGDLEKRSLSPDDIAGVCDVYPSGGGCGCGSGGAPGAVAALLAVLALRPRRRPASR